MIRINLLPVKKIKARLRARNEVLFLLAAILVVCAGVSFVAWSQAKTLAELKVTIKDLTRERDQYNSTIALIEQLKVQKANLDAKLAMIKKLKQGSQIPVRVLDEIAALTPSNRIWLSSLSLSGGALRLTGTALDNATIADYMTGLNSSGYFADAELANSSQTAVGGRKLKSFSLTCQVVSPTEAEEPGAATGKQG